MKLPRDVSAAQLVRVLSRLGYQVSRQRGSHIRLYHAGPPAHSVTVPNRNPLRTGTLHGILAVVAETRSISIESLIDLL